jgi:predicted nucleic acid-binding protein
MRYLLDTNVISEGMKPRPSPSLLSWVKDQPAVDLAISVISFGEIRKGVLLMPIGNRQTVLQSWLSVDLPRQFAGRVLPVDEEVALEWGRLIASGRMVRREPPPVDGLLLATAAVHGLTLVTRNERDCAGHGVPVLNPWSS